MTSSVPPRFFPYAQSIAEAEKRAQESGKVFHEYAKQLRPAMREAERQTQELEKVLRRYLSDYGLS